MKTQIYIYLIAFLLSGSVYAQKAIFLHHSTGWGVFSEGDVAGKINDYNNTNQTNFQIEDLSYPNTPYPWENYPYDFWNIWVNGGCNSDSPGIECLETIVQRYNVVIIKHCFPGANILAGGETPDVGSSVKTLANYKLQYMALLDKLDQFPDTRFVVWTLTPQHRNATNTDEAARAREFVNWVKTNWLTEDAKQHPNIFIFDFFNIIAESNPTPSNGKVNCLKYEYEGDHDGSDGHPNQEANKAAGQEFANFMIQVFQSVNVGSKIQLHQERVQLNFNSELEQLVIKSELNEKMILSIFDMNGRSIYKRDILSSTSQIDVSFLPQGVYAVNLSAGKGEIACLKIVTLN